VTIAGPWRASAPARASAGPGRVIARHYDAYLAESGLTAVQLPILACVAAAEEPTFRLLAEQLDLDRSTLSRKLTLLRARRLIDAPSGLKPSLIGLTAKGKEALRHAHDRWREAQAACEWRSPSREILGCTWNPFD
jgi:DNA-binding MarR family transcriptional regulator